MGAYYWTTLNSEVQAAHLTNLIKKKKRKERERERHKQKPWFVLGPCSDIVYLPTPTPDPYCPLLQVSLECDSVSFWRSLHALLLCGSQWGENPLGCIKSRDLTSNWERKKAFSRLRVPPQEGMLSISLQGRIHISTLHICNSAAECGWVCVCVLVCETVRQINRV